MLRFWLFAVTDSNSRTGLRGFWLACDGVPTNALGQEAITERTTTAEGTLLWQPSCVALPAYPCLCKYLAAKA
jgi:hypothetical protein